MISVSEAPNGLGTFRYDVRVRGSSTHGFRRSPGEAKQAALDDQNLMYLCARVETQEDSDGTEKPRVRRERRERRGRED